MKKALLFLFVLLVSVYTYGQKYQVLPTGISDEGTPAVSLPDYSAGLGVVNLNPESDYMSVWVLPGIGSTSANTRCPGNTWRYQRTEYLITASEIAAAGFPSGAEINSIGWLIHTAGVGTQTGQLNIYLMNTTDVGYTLGTSWTTAGFTQVHSSATFTVPIAAGAYEVPFTGGSTFTYTGGGVYIAWEFTNAAGAIGTTALIANCNTINTSNMLYGNRSATAMPTTLVGTSFRPATTFGNNFYTDIVSVTNIYALERAPIPYSIPTPLGVRVANVSTAPATFNVTITIKDPTNTITRYTSTQTVTALAANTATILNFPWTPTVVEDINITVTAVADPSENFLANNTMAKTASVNTNRYSYNYSLTGFGGLGYFTSGSGIFAAKYTMNGAGIISGANLFVGADPTNTGKTIYAVVCNSLGAVIAQSADYVILATDLGTNVPFTFPVTPILTNEDFFVGLAQPTFGYYPMGTFAEIPVRPNTFYVIAIGGSTPSPLSGFDIKFGIEALVSPYVGVVNPTAFTATPAGLNQIDLSWILNASSNPVMVVWNSTNTFGTPANGTAYPPTSAIPGGGTVIYNSAGTSFNHTGLTPSTVYYYKAWSVNGTNTYSPGVTSSAATFFSIPYAQNFDASTAVPPSWSGTMYVATAHGVSATNGLTENLYDAVPTADGISPNIVLSANQCKLVFDYRIVNWSGYPATATVLGAGDLVEVQISTNNGATYSTIHTINLGNHVTSTSFVTKTINLPIAAGPVKIKFLCTWASGDYYVDVDNFLVEELPLCPPPTGVNATGVTINSAVIGWTGPSVMKLDYGSIGHTAGTGTVIDVVSNPHTLTSLAPGTGYDVYLRYECSPGVFSPWAGPATFTTLEILQITPNPFNFGQVILGQQSSSQVFTIKNNGPSAILIDDVSITGGDNTQFILTDGTTYSYNLLSGASYTVSVVFYPSSTGVKTTNLVVNENETDHSVPLTGTSSCPTPTALTATGLTTTSANLGWNANGTTAWEIEWGPFGFTQGSGNMITAGVTNPHLLSGLTQATKYSFYVRAKCSATVFSGWAGPYTFTTVCLPVSLPYSQNFDAVTVPDIPVCWSRYSSAALRPWLTTNVTNSGLPAYSAPNFAGVFYHPTLPKDEWLVSPAITVTSGADYQVKFWLKAPGWAGTPEKVKLVMSLDPSLSGLASGTVLWDGNNLLLSSYTEFVIPFTPGTAGPYYFAWHAYSAADVDYISLDDITFEVVPVPVNLTVTGTVVSPQSPCYNATNTITVAGGASTFTVASGASATFIAGVKISFLPGTMVAIGGYMLGKISDGTYCGGITPSMPAVLTSQEETPVSLEHSMFSLYPNPTNGNFTIIQKGEKQYGNVKVEIYSMRGERVLSTQMIGEKQHEFVTAALPAGLYFVKVVAGDYTETIKLVKVR